MPILLNGDSLVELKKFTDNTVDSLVCDPPGAVGKNGFMNRKWDAFQSRQHFIDEMKPIFQECLRVMKPGAHGLVWALPKTSNYTMDALEDAGFEIRDVVNHIFGSGFPKSHNVSQNILKCIDNLKSEDTLEKWINNSKIVKIVETSFQRVIVKAGTNIENEVFALEIVAQNINLNNSQLNAIIAELNLLDHLHLLKEKHVFATENVKNNSMVLKKHVKFAEPLLENQEVKLLTVEQENLTTTFIALKNVVEWQNEKMQNKTKEEEVQRTLLGKNLFSKLTDTNALYAELIENLKLTTLKKSETFLNLDTKSQMECVSAINVIITESTMECLTIFMEDILKEILKSQHDGQGSSLKPACENWILVRKPLEKNHNIAQNVLKWGTGAINIDVSRIGFKNDKDKESAIFPLTHHGGNVYHSRTNTAGELTKISITSSDDWTPNNKGRWPANLVLSHSENCEIGICTDDCPIKILESQSPGVSRFFKTFRGEENEND